MNQKVYTFFSVSSFSSNDNGFDLNSILSPTVLVYITLLSFVLFFSALLQLLIKFLLRPQTRLDDAYEERANAPQGRLQTPINLHDSGGVDKSFPLFHYKTLIDLRHDPFDCAVCLCEFKAEDELRLLPKCSHAFHVNCIDTWLLTNSTCPLCRDNLLLDLTASSSPVVILHEFDGERSQDDTSKPENDERVVLHQISGEA